MTHRCASGTSSRQTPSRRRKGMTLLELLLAFSITALIGLAMATVMTAAARGMSGAGQARSALQRVHAAYIRTRAYTDSGLCLLSVDPTRGFAFWLHDETPGGRLNLLELRVFWWNNGDGTLTVERVQVPEAWAPELVAAYNIPIPSAANFFQIMLDQRSLGMTATETIADGLDNASLAFAGTTPMDVERFRMTLTVTTAPQTQEPVLMTFGLMNHTKPL